MTISVRNDTPLRFANTKPDGPLEDDEVASLLRRKIDRALNAFDGEVSHVRRRALDRYRGDPLGTEEPGRSSFLTREVFEMVEGALPSLLSIFFSSKHPVLFEPRGPEDAKAAEQETAIIDHYLFRQVSSFLTFYNLFKSALLDPVAYAKVYCRSVVRTKHHRYEELTANQLVQLTDKARTWKKGVVITPRREPGSGEEVYSFEGTEVIDEPQFIVDAVPPEQVLVDENAVHLDLDDVWENYGFIGHETEEVFSALVARGYDPDELDEAGGDPHTVTHNVERTNRHDRQDELPSSSYGSDYSTRRFTVYECYLKADLDGTGIADSWRVVMIGSTIFEKVKVSYQPFVAMSAIPMPFKHVGMSPSEALDDLQILKTKLLRVALDDMYRNEVRRTYVDKNALTPRGREQMLDPQAAYVELKGAPGAAIMPEPQFSILEETMAVIQYADEAVKRRTGMAPDTALNPDVLRDSTAHGMLASMDRSSARLMSIARTFAETGLRKIGVKFHQLLRMYQDRSTFLEIRGSWVEVNPADWYERTAMKVAVGLGFNSKEQNLQALMQVLGLQKEAFAQGLATPVHIKHTLEQLIESADLGFYGQYFADPEAPGWKPPPPQPDPQMEAVKAQVEITKLQEQTKQQLGQAEIEAKNQEQGVRSQVDLAKIQTDRQKAAAEAMLKRTQAKMEAALLVERKEAEVEKLREETENLRATREKIKAEIQKLLADANASRIEASDALREAERIVSEGAEDEEEGDDAEDE